jgi:DNA-binding MarR family transcriptional regulator
MAGFKIDDCVARRAPGRLIRRIDRLMAGVVDQRLQHSAINYVQWATLKLVKDGTVSTAGDVARELTYTTGAATRVIDGLETQGLVTRERLKDDRRIVRLAVTDAGASLIAAIHPIVVEAWNEMVAEFSQDEANRLVDSLVKLHAAIEAKLVTGALRQPIEEAAE